MDHHGCELRSPDQLRRELILHGLLPKTPWTSPGSVLDRETRKRIVRWCLTQLPEHERQALQNELDGGTDEELAIRENIEVSTVRGRRYRGREQMRDLLERLELTPSKIL